MTPIKCIIVEDEPLAVEVLRNYIDQIPHLSLVATLENAFEAIEFLHREKVDLLFLDIHLPRLTGLDFLKSLSSPPKVIITTAYDRYAMKGYELHVVDYLLKPIEFGRFLVAINKLDKPAVKESIPATVKEDRPFKFFHSDRKKVKVYLDEIIYIESLKEYIRIVTEKQKLIVNLQIGQVKDILPDNFIRIHRSFIVSIPKIESYTSQSIVVNQIELPIGRVYKDMVARLLENFEL